MITGNDIKLLREPKCIYTDPVTGARSMLYQVSVSRSISYTELMKLNKKGSVRCVVLRRRRFFKSINRDFIVFVYSDDVPPSEWEDATSLHLIRPATGQAANVWSYSDITDKYREVESKAEELWTKAEKQAHEVCVHGPTCKRPNCEVGKAIQTIYIVTGQFVVLWGYLQECVPKGKKLRLVQVAVKRREVKGDRKEKEVKGDRKEKEVKGDGKEEKKVKEDGEMEEETHSDAKTDGDVHSEIPETKDAHSDATTKSESHADATSDSDSERTVDTEESIGITDSDDSDAESDAKEEELLITGVRILGSKSEALKEKLREMQEIQEREGPRSLCLTRSGEAAEADGGATEATEGGGAARAGATDAGARENEVIAHGRLGLLATGPRRQLLRVRSRVPSNACARALGGARSVDASSASSVLDGGATRVGSVGEVGDFLGVAVGRHAGIVFHRGEHAGVVSAGGIGE